MISKILDYLNNLNVRQVLILAGATAALMFVVIYLALNYFIEKSEEENAKKIPELPRVTTVVVAKSDIAPRAIIRENMVQIKEIPSESVPNGAITSLSETVDRSAKITILAGDVITKRKLYNDSQPAGFVGVIPPDCRAVSINVNNVTGVAGFAKPGDYVDLLLVENNDVGATTSIILQNILLLSVNKNMDRNEIETDEEGAKVSKAAMENPSIATLALRPQEALRLVSAAKLGDIYLMLRPSNPIENYVDLVDYTQYPSNQPQKNIVETPVVPPAPQPVEEPKPEPVVKEKERTIEIIYGDDDKKSDNEKEVAP